MTNEDKSISKNILKQRAVTHSENIVRTHYVVVSCPLHVDSSSDDVLKSVAVPSVQ
jgi:hypothetical protein